MASLAQPVRTITLIGLTGAGKGTQAEILVAEGWIHYSTGAALRQEIASGSEIGRSVAGAYRDGSLASVEVIERVVEQFVRTLKPEDRVIFDGMPRQLAQYDLLERFLPQVGRDLERAILLEVSPAEARRRVSLRLEQEGRSDDTPEAVDRKFEIFSEEVMPVVLKYEERGVLRRVDGEGTIEEVAVRVKEALS